MAKSRSEKKVESLKSELALDPKRIRASAGKSDSGNAIFLLGFDTEYEKVESTDPEETKSNRVLSYQYCGTIVDE